MLGPGMSFMYSFCFSFFFMQPWRVGAGLEWQAFFALCFLSCAIGWISGYIQGIWSVNVTVKWIKLVGRRDWTEGLGSGFKFSGFEMFSSLSLSFLFLLFSFLLLSQGDGMKRNLQDLFRTIRHPPVSYAPPPPPANTGVPHTPGYQPGYQYQSLYQQQAQVSLARPSPPQKRNKKKQRTRETREKE